MRNEEKQVMHGETNMTAISVDLRCGQAAVCTIEFCETFMR